VSFLLDTHVWLVLQTQPSRLCDDIRSLLADPTSRLLLSTASAWEVAIKYALGKLPLPEPPERYVPSRLRRDGVDPLPVGLSHALHVATLPGHHADPVDRLLVAQAQLEGAVLVTADPLMERYDVERRRAWPS
jgi:PIN domain nuclease of toxin-antitoxin system